MGAANQKRKLQPSPKYTSEIDARKLNLIEPTGTSKVNNTNSKPKKQKWPSILRKKKAKEIDSMAGERLDEMNQNLANWQILTDQYCNGETNIHLTDNDTQNVRIRTSSNQKEPQVTSSNSNQSAAVTPVEPPARRSNGTGERRRHSIRQSFQETVDSFKLLFGMLLLPLAIPVCLVYYIFIKPMMLLRPGHRSASMPFNLDNPFIILLMPVLIPFLLIYGIIKGITEPLTYLDRLSRRGR